MKKTLSIFDNISNSVYCTNCGKNNHIYKECLNPKISVGIILFTHIDHKIKFLMVRRKDTIGYIEFLRGRYVYNDIVYIQNLFKQMTIDELNNLKLYDFKLLWNTLWMNGKKNKYFIKDYNKSKTKFSTIQKGYYLDNIYINLDYFINNVDTKWIETEWGFPKGRRNGKESNIETARRECIEETGLKINDFELCDENHTFIENYTGSDNVKYRHIYYIGKCLKNIDEISIDTKNNSQIIEISKIGFYSLDECNELIRNYYIEKKNVLEKVYKYITENKFD